MPSNLNVAIYIFVLSLSSGCSIQNSSEITLKDTFTNQFMIGAALNGRQFSYRDSIGVSLIQTHFNTITSENSLKWISIHPEPGRYSFEQADQFVQFGLDNNLSIIGHTLVWHNQVPHWVFQDSQGNPVSRDTLLARMRDHIHTVVRRYRGKIKGWDVVNEALNDDGSLRSTRWLDIIGEDYIEKAFEYAHEADPGAELYYNDYSLPNPAKREGALSLIRALQVKSIPVTGIGMQGHYNLNFPSMAQLDSAISAFNDLDIDVMITELDVDVLPPAMEYEGADITVNAPLHDEINPYPVELPDSMQHELADRYADLFGLFSFHRDAITRVTFWGVRDVDSWKNNWPVRGRTNYPLVFDREGKPKPAFHAITRLNEAASH